ncbi:DUF262 domain-containing protein [Aquitalea aquatilis]|uniref:DUF262 domain-containing protein n=1 Tax=Aquitalea aquatilis TaxID=1537400 RepID=UPI0010BD6BCD|nr:DUF262 domain-containing protein [Aquitalea aquatilis]
MGRINRQSTSISISEFYENHVLTKYNYEPEYQRKSIWTDEKQSFLVDSILRNFPIPPIFLHQKIDPDNGKTKFDVVDGKQRLTSIIRFIEGEIPCQSEIDDADSAIAGKHFKDIPLEDIKKEFWRYRIPLELIDADNPDLIDEIFDRLNRNGERLNGQELRNARYYDSPIIKIANEIANRNPFWKERLAIATDVSRMEDAEFISELIFVIYEDSLFGSNQKNIDEKYEKYSKMDDAWAENTRHTFSEITQILVDFNLDYDGFRINGVSHLFGLWSLATQIYKKNLHTDISAQLNEFFGCLRSDATKDKNVLEYKKSMSSGTKEVTQRTRRRSALLSYLSLQ